uniref:Uncharacterized protein n=1 Tax=Candidatus Kentrum sp. FM TaxID=2126340 RepID=A0A450SC03_9GAMM|nr:MAG: hypothetical protein BECKFM1743A_GA0114220_100768 [Candidatus Kentron sp. FM]VFK08607.1 MAG: hypothetical protein BECKFM1743B_GA0114221_100758 [Candidatus Kentron sp. FM]
MPDYVLYLIKGWFCYPMAVSSDFLASESRMLARYALYSSRSEQVRA